MVKIFLDEITKIFKPNTVAVNNLTFEIPDKKVISLLGPSGCGKTTTMRIICGLENPTTGRVYFDDQDVTDMPVEKRDVAMIFQFPVVYPALSVYENIAFPLKAAKIPEAEINTRVKQVAELLNLTSILDGRPSDLDAGKRQRVAIARAIIRRPKAYLFDEPLSNLDPRDRVKLRSELKKLQEELGQTIVYVTHDQAEALTMGDKIAVMNEGKLLQYDTPEVIYGTPSNTFVAWFIGNPGMNLIDCIYRESDGTAFLETQGFTYDVSDIAGIIKKRATGNELIFGIRPEHVEIRTKSERAGIRPSVETDWFSCKSVLAEILGKRILLHLHLGELTIRAKTSLYECVHETKIFVRFPKKYVRIFDKKSQELIV